MDVDEIVKYPDGKINCPCCGRLTNISLNRAERFVAALRVAMARKDVGDCPWDKNVRVVIVFALKYAEADRIWNEAYQRYTDKLHPDLVPLYKAMMDAKAEYAKCVEENK